MRFAFRSLPSFTWAPGGVAFRVKEPPFAERIEVSHHCGVWPIRVFVRTEIQTIGSYGRASGCKGFSASSPPGVVGAPCLSTRNWLCPAELGHASGAPGERV